MTRKNLFQNYKTKLLLALSLICVLCFSLFAVACTDTDDKDSTPNYTYTQTDDKYVSNATFDFGSIDTELTKFPKTSPTGWTKSKDSNGAIGTSSTKSGVINLSDDAWKELLNALYKDSNVIDYIENQLKGKMTVGEQTYTDVKNFVKVLLTKDGVVPTSEEIQKHIIENYFTINEETKTGMFKNPGTYKGAKDKFVYMLNNYRLSSYQGIGTSQKITSSSKITLEKGGYAKISVWIKTQNITVKADGEYGASIRIVNEFNSTAQSDYVVKNITAEDWTQYTIYLKADKRFDTSVKVALGLGYGLAGVTEGTVYFDDVKYSTLTEAEYKAETEGKNFTEKTIAYKSKNAITVNNQINSIYNITMDNSSYISNTDVTLTAVETPSKIVGYDGTPFADSSVATPSTVTDATYGNVTELSLNKASATVNISANNFKLANEKYAYLEFYVKNQLSTWGSTEITINVIDIYGTIEETRKAIATVSTVDDEWQRVGILVKNNFDNGNDRNFKLEVVIGPTDVASAKHADEFATGKVYISPIAIANGDANRYDDNGNETANYQLYELFTTATPSVLLHAGFPSDYNDSADSTIYNFTVSPSDIGVINKQVANVNGFVGVVADHYYVNDESDNSDINTRTEKDANGSIAGLINTNYLSTYKTNYGIDVANALNYSGDAIQPIMIYNAVKDSYGFIGKTNSISASSYAKVSATLKVVGDDAFATIYLVNVAEQQKSVMTFDDFTADNGEKYTGKDLQLQLTITEDMMINGWVTVDFYVATGATSKDFRIEIWNGTRENSTEDSTKSQGYVFVKNIDISTAVDAFEPTVKNQALTTPGNPLFDEYYNNEDFTAIYAHKRAWTDLEVEYNKNHPDALLEDNKGNYAPKYVWATNETFIYAVYNTIDPVKVDPDSNVTTEEDTSEGCIAETDPSTFWLSFSSILLGVVLVGAIVMLFVKNIRRRIKANRSDAKSHYTITSRIKNKPRKEEKPVDDVVEKSVNPVEEVPETETESEDTDDYVYGEVEVFDDDKKDSDNE